MKPPTHKQRRGLVCIFFFCFFLFFFFFCFLLQRIVVITAICELVHLQSLLSHCKALFGYPNIQCFFMWVAMTAQFDLSQQAAHVRSYAVSFCSSDKGPVYQLLDASN